MANTFVNASASILTTPTDIYICPLNTSSVVYSLYFSNIDGISDTNVTVEVWDSSASSTRTLGKNLPIPVGSTLEFGKVSLEQNDVLRASAPLVGDVQAFASILEIS